jgi:HEAT repeat protein
VKAVFACPDCGLRFSARAGLAAQALHCPKCGRARVAPVGSDPPPEGPPAPRRWGWPNLFTLLALVLGVAALPLAAALSVYAVGIALAGAGLLLGLLGLGVSLGRRGAGLWLALASPFVCASVAVVAVALCFLPAVPWPAGLGAPGSGAGSSGQAKGAARGDRPGLGRNPEEEDERPPRPPGNSRPRDRGALPAPANQPEQPPAPLGNARLDRLVKGLKGETAAERRQAAEELAKLGEAARPAARALCEAAAGGDESVRRSALEALEKVHPSLYHPVTTLLVDENRWTQQQAGNTLAAMGSEARAAVPVVLAHLNQSRSPRPGWIDPSAVLTDIAVLGRIGPDDPAVVRELIELAKLQPGRPFYLQSGIHAAAVRGLQEAGKADPALRGQIVPVLVSALDNSYPDAREEQTRLAAIAALEAFGSDSTEAVPVLKKLKLDPSMPVRQAAAAALEKIESPK